MIDEMDSKMMVLDKAYKDVAEGETTDRIFALDGRTFYKPHKH
jgi:3'-5' exoribonuclease